MKKIGIFYGSSTGYTADVANRIASALGVEMADVYNVANTAPSKLGDYDVLLLGCSTWGAGDMQPDFEDFIDGASALALPGKKIGIFGCGDENMAMTFGEGLDQVYKRMQSTGAEFIGAFNVDGYRHDDTPAVVDGICVGLLIDDMNHADLTDKRIAAWTDKIKEEIN